MLVLEDERTKNIEGMGLAASRWEQNNNEATVWKKRRKKYIYVHKQDNKYTKLTEPETPLVATPSPSPEIVTVTGITFRPYTLVLVSTSSVAVVRAGLE